MRIGSLPAHSENKRQHFTESWQSSWCTIQWSPSTACVLDTAGIRVIGTARIADFESFGGDYRRPRPLADVELILERFRRTGLSAVTELPGVYAVVIVDERRQEVHAVRDALGIQPIYYRAKGHILDISDDLDSFDASGDPDLDFIAAFISTGLPSPKRTIWRDISPIPSGSCLEWSNGKHTLTTYWSADMFDQTLNCDQEQLTEHFRTLFCRAVVQELEPDGQTWADLSGGHDSSSVCCAATTAGNPNRYLGGTVTFSDTLGGGNETAYVNAVLKRYNFRNLHLKDVLPFSDDGKPPPRISDTARDYPFYARDRFVAQQLRRYGGRVLLSGLGPDYYLPRTARHVADLIWTGRLGEGFDELVKWARFRRQSFWKALQRNVFLPVAPVPFQYWYLADKVDATPDWLVRTFTNRFGFGVHQARYLVAHGLPGSMMKAKLASRFGEIGNSIHNWRPGIELRHPGLYRPLVEFSLRLPQALRTDAVSPKPILRSAMQGIVPSEVLDRRTKGSLLGARICLAMARESALMEELTKDPILADLGCVEPDAMLTAIRETASGRGPQNDCLYYALSLEMWLSVRAGRKITWVRRNGSQVADQDVLVSASTS